MRITSWMLAVAFAVIFGMVIAFPLAAQSKKQLKQAGKLLEKLKLVDGPGSELDADTVHGMTPEQVAALITPPTPQATLAALQQVDGAGSGLDADTLRGLTPQQLMSSTGGASSLRIVDSTGAEVGALVDLGSALRQLPVPLPGGVRDEWFDLPVGRAGFRTRPEFDPDVPGVPAISDFDFSYATANCTMTRYFRPENSPSGLGAFGLTRQFAFIGHDLVGYYWLPEENQLQQYYDLTVVGANNATEAAQQCASSFQGQIVGQEPSLCSGTAYCGKCCFPRRTRLPGGGVGPGPTDGSPVRTIDLASLGLVPPFSIQR